MQRPDGDQSLRGFWGLVAAQFLGAFNDNALRWFLIALAMHEIRDEHGVARVMTLASVSFLAPYLIFSMHAGWLADHFSKRAVLMASKATEAAIMALCVLGFVASDSFSFTRYFLLGALFLLGVQATYYSPAKFGILPEILPENRLSWGNGIFEMTGTLAIVVGSIVGAECVGLFHSKLYCAPVVFSAAAVLGIISTWFLPRVPAAASVPLRINPVRALLAHSSMLLRRRILLITLLAVVFLWSLGVLLQLNLALYAKENLGLEERHAAYPMGIVAVGVGVGTLLAGFLSGKTIEVGLVPIGSVGLGLAAAALFFTPASLALTLLVVGLLGAFAGLFIVPTHALLQEESPVEDKGGIWAATNFLQTVGMLLASATFYLLNQGLKLTPPEAFLVCGCGTLALAFALMALLPESLGRMLAWLRTWLGPPVQIQGQDNVPPQGPVLFLLAGPPSDRFYLLLAGTRRFVRFVLPGKGIQDRVAWLVARKLGVIHLSNPLDVEAVERAAKEIEAALRSGHSVGIFSAGGTTEPEAVNLPGEAIARLLDRTSASVQPVILRVDTGSIALEFQPVWDRKVDAGTLLSRLSKAVQEVSK